MINDFAKLIPENLTNVSGSVFYSGQNAFSGNKKLYLLGINPGGSVEKQRKETIKWHTDKVIAEKPKNWSAYKNESWRGKIPGTHGLQPRILHLLNEIGLTPIETPASNVVFVRSSREENIKKLYKKYAEQCWPVHEKVIKVLNIKTILCFGQTPGNFVRKKINANKLIDTFTENNNRKWKTRVYQNSIGQKVIVAPHPSIVDWTNINTDPSTIVKKHLR